MRNLNINAILKKAENRSKQSKLELDKKNQYLKSLSHKDRRILKSLGKI